ncbi:hypothetical protein P8452_00884 [Trifolium repens]|nr:hypothetical protein P8452_00884 [Trifolium repens]
MDCHNTSLEDTETTKDLLPQCGKGMATVMAMGDTSEPNVASNKSKESSGETTPSDLPNQEDILKKVFDEMKVLTTKVADLEAVNTKMLRILVGMVRLQIQTPDVKGSDKTQQKSIVDDGWVSVGKPAEAVDEDKYNKRYEELEDMTKDGNLYEVLKSVTNDFNLYEEVDAETNSSGKSHKTPSTQVANIPVLTGISTVLLDDDGQNETTEHIKSGSVPLYENKLENKNLRNLDKGKSQLVFDTEDRLNENASDKYFSSNYRRFSINQDDMVDMHIIAKKLSFTPSPTSYKRQKNELPVGNGSGKGCMTSTPLMGVKTITQSYSQKRQRNYKFKSVGAILPKYVRCTFRPTVQMHLSKEEAILSAYMFREDPTTSNDLVFGVGNIVLGIRSEFQNLVPGGSVGGAIITMMAARVTWIQKESMTPDLWCLHPAFATDVLNGYDIDKLEIIYRRDWMFAYKTLKLIYVPIEEESGHWFLMVIHIEERKVYHLDSHLVAEKVGERHRKMKKIAGVMSDLLLTIYNCDVGICLLPDFNNWEIVEPRGVPNCGHSENSGLWVTEWLNMQSNFNNQIIGVMNDNTVRMKIAMRLLVGAHNNCKNILEVRSKTLWDNIMAGLTS